MAAGTGVSRPSSAVHVLTHYIPLRCWLATQSLVSSCSHYLLRHQLPLLTVPLFSVHLFLPVSAHLFSCRLYCLLLSYLPLAIFHCSSIYPSIPAVFQSQLLPSMLTAFNLLLHICAVVGISFFRLLFFVIDLHLSSVLVSKSDHLSLYLSVPALSCLFVCSD